MTAERAVSILLDRSDSAEPITAQELAKQMDCGKLVAYRCLTELEKIGIIKSKRAGSKKLVWWVPENTDWRTSYSSIWSMRNEVKQFCAEAEVEHLVKTAIQILEDAVSSEKFKSAEQWHRERWIAAAVRIASEEGGKEIKYSKLSEYTEKANSSQITTRAHEMKRNLSD